MSAKKTRLCWRTRVNSGAVRGGDRSKPVRSRWIVDRPGSNVKAICIAALDHDPGADRSVYLYAACGTTLICVQPGGASLQTRARPTAAGAARTFGLDTRTPRQLVHRSNSVLQHRPSEESGHAEPFVLSPSISSPRFEVHPAPDSSIAQHISSAWHTSLCHAASPLRSNLQTRLSSCDRALAGLRISRQYAVLACAG
jgi:hypothetical protein